MYSTIDDYSYFSVRKEHFSAPYTILIKFPSRSRPEKLVSMFREYISKANNSSDIKVLFSLDHDDSTVTPELCSTLKSIHSRVDIRIGTSTSKINAVNRDMEHAGDYDILLLASDDMKPVEQGYDDIIRTQMKTHAPNLDGVLWFNDGFQGRNLNTLCILGKPYYDRFGYIYHPSYKSFFCDNEFMEVADRLQKQFYFHQMIIQHLHPDVIHSGMDELYRKNSDHFQQDQNLYHERKRNNFP